MEEKLRQGPSNQVPSNTLKEEKASYAPCGASPGFKQEKFVEGGLASVATSWKSEVQQKPTSPESRGYPAEEKLREIVNPVEEPAAVWKEQGVSNAPSFGDPWKVDEKLHTSCGAAAAADTPPKEAMPKSSNDMAVPRMLEEKSQAASSSSLPAEQKLQELPQKVVSTSFKEDDCKKEAESKDTCTQEVVPNGRSLMGAPKEEKVNKGPSLATAPFGKKEEKLQEACPAAIEVELQMPAANSVPPTPPVAAPPSDAARSQHCCALC